MPTRCYVPGFVTGATRRELAESFGR
jgi:hypothetical protein